MAGRGGPRLLAAPPEVPGARPRERRRRGRVTSSSPDASERSGVRAMAACRAFRRRREEPEEDEEDEQLAEEVR